MREGSGAKCQPLRICYSLFLLNECDILENLDRASRAGENCTRLKNPATFFTFDGDLVLSSVGVSEDLDMNGHLAHGVVHPGA